MLAEGESYTEISVERLCTQAGVARSTFYTYYGDKGHLLRELTGELLRELGDVASEWWERGPAISRAELEAVVLRLARTYREHDLLMAAVADTAVYDPEVREVFEGLVNEFIEESQAALGVPRETAALLVWMTVQGYYEMVRGAKPAEVKRVAAAQTEIIWRVAYGDK